MVMVITMITMMMVTQCFLSNNNSSFSFSLVDVNFKLIYLKKNENE